MSGNTKNQETEPPADSERLVEIVNKVKAAGSRSSRNNGNSADKNSNLPLIADYYAEILNQISDAVIVVDNQERVVYLNPATERQYEVSGESCIGLPLGELHSYVWLNKKDEEKAYASLRETGSWRGENIHIKNSGDRIFVESTVSVLRDAGDQPMGMLAIIRDITERKRTEETLRASERQNREILESISDGFFALDENWRYSYVNSAAVKILGVASEALLGKTIWETYPGLAGSEFERVYRRAAEEKISLSLTAYYPEHERWYEVNIFPAANGITVYFRNVTEIKQAEDKLRETSSVLNAINLNTPTAIYVKDRDCRMLSANPATCRIIGKPLQEIVGKNHAEYMDDPGGAAAILANDLEIIKSGRTQTFEETIERTDESRIFLSTKTPYRNESGEIIGLIGVSVDITGRKQAEEKLRESEHELRSLADSIPHLAWMAEPDGFIFWYNRRWYEYTGTMPEEMEGWGWEKIHDAQMLSEVLEQWKRSIATGEPFEMEFPLKGADGGYRWFLTRVNPVRDSNAKITRWFGTNTDIDEQRRLRDALARNERELQQMADAMPQVVWIANAEGDVYYYNRQVENFSGIEKTGDTWKWQPILHPDDLEETIKAWETAIAEKKLYVKEHRIMMSGGGYRWHLSRAFPAFDISGNIAKWYGTATDIHELKEAEAERRELLEKADAANRAKDQFLAILSHELRAPLNTIYGWTQMLLKNNLDADRAKKAIEVIARSVRLQNALIEDLLDVSRIISGKMRLEPETVSLVSIVNLRLTPSNLRLMNGESKLSRNRTPKPTKCAATAIACSKSSAIS